MHNGEQILVVGLRKETGANVLEMSDRVEEEVNRLNEKILAEKGIYIELVYDQRSYIITAIDLVKKKCSDRGHSGGNCALNLFAQCTYDPDYGRGHPHLRYRYLYLSLACGKKPQCCQSCRYFFCRRDAGG